MLWLSIAKARPVLVEEIAGDCIERDIMVIELFETRKHLGSDRSTIRLAKILATRVHVSNQRLTRRRNADQMW